MPDRTDDDLAQRRQKAAVAGARFIELTADLASEHRFGGPGDPSTKVEIEEEANRLVREARARKHANTPPKQD